jgi:hypothetical protein
MIGFVQYIKPIVNHKRHNFLVSSNLHSINPSFKVGLQLFYKLVVCV